MLRSLRGVAARTPQRSVKRSIGSCCIAHYFEQVPGGETAFTIRTNHVKYGNLALQEIGSDVSWLIEEKGTKTRESKNKVVIVTDNNVRQLPFFTEITHSLSEAGHEVIVFSDVHIEPTVESFLEAARFVKEAQPSCVVSVGGGSSMDTAKAALLYAYAPPSGGNFFQYVNAPVGLGKPVPRLGAPPHLAVPTTAGTGSECTGIAIFKVGTDHPSAPLSKSGIISPRIIPDLAIVDPVVTHSLTHTVLAASGFDLLSHAIESFTARPFTRRNLPNGKTVQRPMNQGANPYCDFGCLEALRICGTYFQRALTDPKDFEAREQMLWAATLAGVAIGNAGTHLPHGLSYPVSGRLSTTKTSFHPGDGYPKYHDHDCMVPHGMSVILCAPAAMRASAQGSPERHLLCANTLGVDTKGASPKDSGEILSKELIRLIRVAGFPNGISAVGFGPQHVSNLTESCWQQKRVIDNAPLLNMQKEDVSAMYHDAMKYW